MTKINLEYFGMPGSGATVKEAKADAGRKIEEFISEAGAPILLSHRGYLLCMSRDRFGWGYRFWRTSEMKVRTSADHCTCGISSQNECLVAAVRHLAEVAREHGERDSELFDAIYNERERSRERAEFARRAEQNDLFHARYQEAIALGMQAGDAHDYALMNPSRRELWEPKPEAA